jgi:membrane protein YqaA with SNARE-associated domain
METDKTMFEKFKETLELVGKTTTDSTTKAVQNYYNPTPVKWRVIGDSILIVGTTLTTVAGLLSLSPYVVASAAVITMIGKILTNFFTK